eukprot:TRINITY_DN4660_c0_g2_i6.p1 TRINITY_DN4660_c0_g2~~TRINITY_DN4660_c0_g2_i6.p1  ORF type:complete len:368 (-),score=83.74 TRINITY_DN4660_c0_g2_i6:64-1167(-)
MSAGLIVFFALVILIATSLMLRPLRLLRQQMGSAARLEGDFLRSRELPFSWSPLSEISSIAYSLFKMKQMLTSFSRYVPMQVVTWLIRRDKIASLGVRKTYCTTMFCDIADFTSLTERTAPSVLMEVFTEFMDTVCASTMRNNGTIDKIIGDCVMAFWGSPDEVPNQEEDACRNALECRAALQKAQALWASNGLPVFRARIGMAAGTVLAGNSGASDRFQFTVLGDPVNLASRLEGLNKAFDTSILIDGNIHDRVFQLFATRKLATVKVKGKSRASEAYELVGEVGQCPEKIVCACDAFTAAVQAFERRDFSKCLEQLQTHRLLLDGVPDGGGLTGTWATQLESEARCYLENGTPPGFTHVRQFEKM